MAKVHRRSSSKFSDGKGFTYHSDVLTYAEPKTIGHDPDRHNPKDTSFGIGHMMMIFACIILGTILLLITVWFCCTLYDDFCSGGKKKQQNEEENEEQKVKSKKQKSRRKSRQEFEDEVSIIVSSPRKSHFGSGGQKRQSHDRSSRHPQDRSPLDRLYQDRSKYYYDDNSTITSTTSPQSLTLSVNSGPSTVELSEQSVSNSQSGNPDTLSIPGNLTVPMIDFSRYVSSSKLIDTPTFTAGQDPNNSSHAQALAKNTEGQKKFNFKI